MTIKLIALDLDGTTLNHKRVISSVTRETLKEAAQKGVNIVVATGRPRMALPKDVYEIGAIRYVITSNGAQVTDLRENKVVYRNCMSPETAERAAGLISRYPYPIEAFTDGHAYINADYYEYVKETGECFRDPEYVLTTREPVEDIIGFILENKQDIENINVNFEDMADKAKMAPVLRTIPGATITSSFKNNLEIGGETTSKADALAKLCHILGVSKDEMMAAGDSPNDIAMLKAAGLSVAMGNAEEEVKAEADYVTLSNAEDGVAAAIRKFVLESSAYGR